MATTGATAVALFDAWEKREFDKVMALIAPGGMVRDFPQSRVLTDRGDIRAWMESWATACPDSTVGVTVAAAGPDAAVVQGVYVGTNNGPFGPLEPTGRTVSMPFAIAMRFDNNGGITHYDVYYDMLTLLTQLGQVPATA